MDESGYLKYTLSFHNKKLWMLFKIFQGSDIRYEKKFGVQEPSEIPTGICSW